MTDPTDDMERIESDDQTGDAEPTTVTRRRALKGIGLVAAGPTIGGAFATEGAVGPDQPIVPVKFSAERLGDVSGYHAARLPDWLVGLAVDGDDVAIEVEKEAGEVPILADRVVEKLVEDTDLTRGEAEAAVAAFDALEPTQVTVHEGAR